MTISGDEIARWTADHRRDDFFAQPAPDDVCRGCFETWPCPTTRLLALVAAQAEQIAELRAALADFADHGLSADLMPTTPRGRESIPHLYRYLARLDQSVRERARAALDGTGATP